MLKNTIVHTLLVLVTFCTSCIDAQDFSDDISDDARTLFGSSIFGFPDFGLRAGLGGNPDDSDVGSMFFDFLRAGSPSQTTRNPIAPASSPPTQTASVSRPVFPALSPVSTPTYFGFGDDSDDDDDGGDDFLASWMLRTGALSASPSTRTSFTSATDSVPLFDFRSPIVSSFGDDDDDDDNFIGWLGGGQRSAPSSAIRRNSRRGMAPRSTGGSLRNASSSGSMFGLSFLNSLASDDLSDDVDDTFDNLFGDDSKDYDDLDDSDNLFTRWLRGPRAITGSGLVANNANAGGGITGSRSRSRSTGGLNRSNIPQNAGLNILASGFFADDRSDIRDSFDDHDDSDSYSPWLARTSFGGFDDIDDNSISDKLSDWING